MDLIIVSLCMFTTKKDTLILGKSPVQGLDDCKKVSWSKKENLLKPTLQWKQQCSSCN